MRTLVLLIAALLLPAPLFAQDNAASSLPGTAWFCIGDTGSAPVFVALEFEAEQPNHVLLTLPNGAIFRKPAAFELNNDSISIAIRGGGGGQARLLLSPKVVDDELTMTGILEPLAGDGETAVDTFELVCTQWTPPEAFENQVAYEGEIVLPGNQKLGILFRLGSSDEGASARLDIPLQGIDRYPAKATLTETGWRIEANVGSEIVFELTKEGDTLNGTMSQIGLSMEVALHKIGSEELNRNRRPQTPVAPFPYASEEVEIEHADGHTLAGTLLLPNGVKSPPVAVLITGSGAQNRNEALMGHEPFLVIADYLARNGIASLRCDDRGTAGSTGNFATATTVDFASDALAQVLFLRDRDDVDTKAIGLIGHSEGGLVAPMVVGQDDAIAFAVLMAGTGVDGGRILTSQTEKMMELAGTERQGIDAVIVLHEALMNAVRNDKGTDVVRERFIALSDAQFDLALSEVGEQRVAELKAATRQELAGSASPINDWMSAFIKLDPRHALAQVYCPVLAINGSHDVQVLPELNLPEIERAVTTGGGTITIRLYGGLNHLFQQSPTGAVHEYAEIETTIEPEVLQDVTDFILEVTGRSAQ